MIYKELRLLGITFNQIENGVYAMILEEVDGQRRLPIVVGYPEAQSIECKLQDVKTPRPLTHDVMADILTHLRARLSDVFIYRLPNGVYAANLNLIDSTGRKLVIDSRSSDAIAVAIRVGAPIFTSEAVLEEASFLASEKPDKKFDIKKRKTEYFNPSLRMVKDKELTGIATEELEKELDRLVSEERYEEASRIKAELERRKCGNSSSDK